MILFINNFFLGFYRIYFRVIFENGLLRIDLFGLGNYMVEIRYVKKDDSWVNYGEFGLCSSLIRKVSFEKGFFFLIISVLIW